jgi:putative resolvase
MRVKMLRVGEVADLLGVDPQTVRRYSDSGRLPFTRNPGNQRVYDPTDVDRFLGVKSPDPVRVEALYVRVSGSTGQESSLSQQEKDLRSTSVGEVGRVYKDTGSGLSSSRRGLQALLRDAALGKFTVVRVTHKDRLARFGVEWIEQLLAKDGVSVEILSERADKSLHPEMMDDFMSLVASFAGRFYQLRSRENQTRLLQGALSRVASDG